MSEESALVRWIKEKILQNLENLGKYHHGNRPAHAPVSFCNNPENKNPGDVPAPDIRMVFRAGGRLFAVEYPGPD